MNEPNRGAEVTKGTGIGSLRCLLPPVRYALRFLPRSPSAFGAGLPSVGRCASERR